jgi:hypothetical protein
MYKEADSEMFFGSALAKLSRDCEVRKMLVNMQLNVFKHMVRRSYKGAIPHVFILKRN